MDLNPLSLDEKVGQLFFIGISGAELDTATSGFLDEISPGGVCLFARNIKSREQTRKLLDDLRAYMRATPLLSVDQEGGLVDRLRRIMTPMPAAGTMKSVEDASELGAIVGEALAVFGFNMDFAPVIDVVTPERGAHSNGLYNRPFGSSKEDALRLASAFAGELRANGILTCIKHFPGYGATQVDSHEELPFVEISDSEMWEVDLHPYRAMLPSADSVMIAHAVFPQSGYQERDAAGRMLPSSLSTRFVTDLLRERLGFDGLVVTDDLEMGAVIRNYGIGEACKLAILAGADMLAICADAARIREGYRYLLHSVHNGEITEDRINRSLQRIASVKSRVAVPPAFDNARLDELSARIEKLNSRLI